MFYFKIRIHSLSYIQTSIIQTQERHFAVVMRPTLNERCTYIDKSSNSTNICCVKSDLRTHHAHVCEYVSERRNKKTEMFGQT